MGKGRGGDKSKSPGERQGGPEQGSTCREKSSIGNLRENNCHCPAHGRWRWPCEDPVLSSAWGRRLRGTLHTSFSFTPPTPSISKFCHLFPQEGLDPDFLPLHGSELQGPLAVQLQSMELPAVPAPALPLSLLPTAVNRPL